MSDVKQVRFSDNQHLRKDNAVLVSDLGAGDVGRQPVDLSSLLKEPLSDVAKKKKKRRKKKTEFQKLKSEKKKLLHELKKTRTSIKEDSERKRSPAYTPYENRQRLARSTSQIQSKVKQLEDKISVKGKLRREKIQQSFKTKIKTTTIKAEKQHGRLIDLTKKLDELKMDEEDLRSEIYKEKSLSSLTTPSTSRCHSSAFEMIPMDKVAPMPKWLEISDQSEEKSGETESIETDDESVATIGSPILKMYRLGSSSSTRSELSLEEKEVKADKLAKKYDFTRELRNITHEHMITRSYGFSYSNIIPPYKHQKEKPTKTRQVYNRSVYEDRLNVLEFMKKTNKLPVIT